MFSLSDLAVSFLQKHFDQYVDGISSENLHYSLRNGHVELDNLALKKEALDNFELPVQVRAGMRAPRGRSHARTHEAYH